MKFKVGDKVKITDKFPNSYYVGLLCEICQVRIDSIFSYEVRRIDDKGWKCLVKFDEIEKVAIKGEQLLFEFML